MSSESNLPDVSFYELDSSDIDAKFRTACRLIAQAYTMAKSVFVLTATEDDARRMDEMLWSFPNDRFIPHVLGDDLAKPSAPVRIHHELLQAQYFLLINLTTTQIANLHRFERIFEIVLQTESDATRQRKRHYTDLECTVVQHQIRTGAAG